MHNRKSSRKRASLLTVLISSSNHNNHFYWTTGREVCPDLCASFACSFLCICPGQCASRAHEQTKILYLLLKTDTNSFD